MRRRCVSTADCQLYLVHLEMLNSSTLSCSRHEQTCAFAFHRAEKQRDTFYLYILVLSLGLCSSSSFAWSYGAPGWCCSVVTCENSIHLIIGLYKNYFLITWPSVSAYLATRCQVSQYKCFVSWSTSGTHHWQGCFLFSPPFGRRRHHNHVGRAISLFFV